MRAFRSAGLALVAASLVVVAAPVARAAAAITIESGPAAQTNDATPTFSGSTEDLLLPVTLQVYEGDTAEGTPVRTETTLFPPASGTWTLSVSPALSDRTYTAVAEQGVGPERSASAPVTFRVDTVAPVVTLEAIHSPTDDSTPTLTGAAGTEPGDIQTVTVDISRGETMVVEATAQASGGAWSLTSPHLVDGTYTAVALQEDEAHNSTTTRPITFRIDTVAPDVTLNAVTPLSNDPTPTFDGGAGTAEGDLSAVTVKVYAGTTDTGIPAQTLLAEAAAGSWSASTLTPLTDGTYTAVAEQSDEAANTGESHTTTFTVDTTRPHVTLNGLAPLGNDPTPTFSGTAGTATGDLPAITVEVYAGPSPSASPVQTLVATATGGSWTITSPGLPDGTYTAVAEQSDEAGNTGMSGTTTFTIDTAAPKVTLKRVTALSNDPTPTFSGTAETATHDLPAITVEVYAGTSASGSPVHTLATTATGGSWTITSPELPDSTYTAVAEQSDEAGNTGVSTPSSTFTIDTVAPRVTLNPLPPVIDTATPTFSGEAGTEVHDTAVVSVNVYPGKNTKGNKPTQTLLAIPSGASWAATSAKALKEGTYTAVAEQSDEAGNTGVSETTTFTVDTKLPKVTLNSLPALGNDPTPTFSGSAGTGEFDLPAITVEVYAGTSPSGSPAHTLSTTASGGSWAVGSPTLPDGTYTAVAEQSSQGGSTGVSVPVTFEIDTTPPDVTLTALPALLNKTTPRFSGGAGVAPHDIPTVMVKIYVGSSASGSPAQTLEAHAAGGSWSATPTTALAQGTYTARAEQSDEAENTGASDPTTFTIDTTKPGVTLNELAAATNDPTPTFSGKAGTATHDLPAITVNVYSGSTTSGSPVQTLVAKATGGSWTITSPGLADHTYTAVAEQADEAQNVGKSASWTFTVDTVPPAVTLTPLPEITAENTPSLSGSAANGELDLPAITIDIYPGTAARGTPAQTLETNAKAGKWSTQVEQALADGTYTATAQQADKAHNVGVSSPSTFTVKTKGPKVALNPVRAVSNDPTPSFSGTAETAGGDSLVTVKVYGGSSVAGKPVQTLTATQTGGSWSTEPATRLADGEYTAVAEQEDGAHNVGKSPDMSFVVDTTPPHPTVTSPAEDATTTASSQLVTGSAGDETGDLPAVTVELFAGSGTSATLLESHTLEADSAHQWATTFAPLAVGTYTVRAVQHDKAGNEGTSASVTFGVVSPPSASASARPPSAPVASFTWVPAAPHVGEPVTLISNSAGGSAPLQTLSWDPAGSGRFLAGGQLLQTTFATVGAHLVQLRVTDVDGQSSVVAHTIEVSPDPLVLMEPFPVVRIVGSETRNGVAISLLSVQAPLDARVTVACRGKGCPMRLESRIAHASKKRANAASVLVTFPRFARTLRGGVVLKIRVSKAGEIGKYTSFSIHRHGLPTRSDACVAASSPNPIGCPT